MKKIFSTFLLFVAFGSFAQSVNDYKYVILPTKFSFLKEDNQYNLNALTKSMLEKYGFTVFYSNENLPDEVGDYNCNKLYGDVQSVGGFMVTKLVITLKDCKDRMLFISDEGKSREKEYQISYNLALREASKSFDNLGYKYNGSVLSVEKTVVKTTNDGTSVKKEIVPATTEKSAVVSKEFLFAQPIENGYQLVDSSPKVVMKIFNTNSKDMFMAEKGELRGVLRNENKTWVFEYYKEGKLVSETLNVKF